MSRLNTFRRSALALAVAMAAHGAHAQSNTSGYIFGQAASGTVVVENLATGLKREVAVDADGNFRAGALPTGRYRVSHDGQSREVSVNVGTGTAVSFASDAAALDVVEVTGDMVNPIDLSSVESTSIFTEAQFDAVPVARNVTGVALLAPGTTRGDTAFGNLASFGGSSVAENAYYINGFNVTNIYKGVAYSQLPFEAISETQVKTGGYGAEFGRSTGGVINIITKRGGNDWHFGANAYWSPDALSEDNPDVHYADGDLYNRNGNESADSVSYAAYASGPIIEDRLFFFALAQQNQRESETAGNIVNSRYYSNDGTDPLWLAKIDWNISDNHLLEVTGFSDTRKDDTMVSFLDDNNDRGTDIGTTRYEEGGSNFIAKYTGYLTDNFTLSALYGTGKYKRQSIADNSCPLVFDFRDTPNPIAGCWSATTEERPDGGDQRDALRIDGEWVVGDHQLRFGYDR
ncbi:MAG: TonB-dependent receptor, partial [Lysobacter sp.]|nr:TonB-dependent receptor [Lysobacter sp.]